MCLIAHRVVSGGRGSNIPNRVIEYNRTSNPDGFGLAWRKDGKLNYQKFGPERFEEFEKLLKQIDADTTIEYAAHWRWATHGPKCEELAHPFVYRDEKAGEVAIFHNGVIPLAQPTGKESDTSLYVKSVLANIEARWWQKPVYRYLVAETIGHSRLLVMTAKESLRMGNPEWKKDNGIFYSTNPLPSWSSWTPGKSAGKGAQKDTATASTIPYSLPGSTKAVGYEDDDVEYERWLRDHADNGDPDDGQETAIIAYESRSADVYSSGGWLDRAATPPHWVEPASVLVGDSSDYGEQDIICSKCQTYGKIYFVQGKGYPSVNHLDNEPTGPRVLVPVSA